jgi:hypothetical protein
LTATRDLASIFGRIEAVLLEYAPPFVVRSETPRDKRNVHLWSERDVEVAGRKRGEVYFAGAIAQKGYVGFYYMPVYTDAERRDLFAPALLPLLKGKSCFHVKELGAERLGQIEDALERGFALYRERGWV